MQLDDFISQTLEQIAQGVHNAQEHCNLLGARVNPAGLKKRVTGEELFWDLDGVYAQRVAFDVAVTATSDTKAGGKAGITVWGALDAGASGERSSSNSTVSRISFSVLMILPSSPVPTT
jgi:hypothetical protein